LPKLTQKYYLNFYGGEPLLSFDIIKKTVSFLKTKNKELHKRAHFTITTNGSLLSEEMISFFNKNRFSMVLSFDGLVHNRQRKKGSSGRIVGFIKELIRNSNIDLEINSTFTPTTVERLAESIKFIIDLNVSNIRLSLSTMKIWDQASLEMLRKEMAKLRKVIINHFRIYGTIPVVNFREFLSKRIFYCAAGKDRLALTPDGDIWGCYLFPEYLIKQENSEEYNKFYFGDLNTFKKDYEHIYPKKYLNYAQLSVDNFSTKSMKCFLCYEMENCAPLCPVNAAFSRHRLGHIPKYVCEIQKIKIKEKEVLWEEIGHVKKSSYYHHHELS
jgi:radical SAM protein with 4Fe4S-binding SPASM domain